MATVDSPIGTESRLAQTLRVTTLSTLLLGACISLGLMVHRAQTQQSRLLMLLFTIWVLGPFVVGLGAYRLTRDWTTVVRQVVRASIAVLALGSVIVYGYDAWHPRTAQAGKLFVLVPALAGSLTVFVVVAASVIMNRGRRRKHPR